MVVLSAPCLPDLPLTTPGAAPALHNSTVAKRVLHSAYRNRVPRYETAGQPPRRSLRSGIQRYDQPARRLGRGVAADYVVQRPARLQGVYEGSVRKACSTCDVYAGHEGVDEAAQAGGFFAEAFTGDANAADAASGGRGQHERGASVRLPTRSPVHVDVHGRSAGAKIRLYARLCRTPSARPMCAARSGGPTQRSLGVYV